MFTAYLVFIVGGLTYLYVVGLLAR